MIELDFEDFDFVAGFLHVPANVLWYRAASSDVATLGDECIYVGPKYVADFYASGNPQRIHCVYRNPRALRLLDVRFVQQIIPYILTHRPNTSINANTMRWYKSMTVAFGACSLRRQIELMHEIKDGLVRHGTSIHPVFQAGLSQMERFLTDADANANPTINPIEKAGVRVGITDIDYFVVTILRQLFSQVDGIIAPRLFTPYHNQGAPNSMLPEMVVFHPARVLEGYEPGNATPEVHRLQDIVHQSFGDMFHVSLGYRYLTMPPQGGGHAPLANARKCMGGDAPDSEVILAKMRKGVKCVIQRYESAVKFAESIDKDKLPAFLHKFVRPPKGGEMRDMLNWNVCMAEDLSRSMKS